MSKQAFLLIFLFLNTLKLSAQIDISGEWKGLVRQHIMGSFTDSPYQLEITQDGNLISGIAHIEASEYLTIYAKMSFTGKIEGDSVFITEEKFLEGTDLSDAVGWCIKHLRLKYQLAKTGYQLKGNWSGYGNSNGEPCKPGIVLMERETGKFTGILQDSITQELLSSTVYVYNLTKKQKFAILETYENEGEFKFFADSTDTYQLLITASGYHDKDYYLNTNEVGLSDTIQLKPVNTGDLIDAGNVQFQQSSPIILEQSLPKLNKLARFLNENTDLKIEISGHTSNEGDPEKNKALSLERAKTVANYLIQKGIDQDRLSMQGYGSERPIADNNTILGKKKNRRVEFRVL
ncbi:MAG: hypothetical protein CMO01_07475 [Thalassobius sp.]|nr:hypothetical protein [Thalassovita sp.]